MVRHIAMVHSTVAPHDDNVSRTYVDVETSREARVEVQMRMIVNNEDL